MVSFTPAEAQSWVSAYGVEVTHRPWLRPQVPNLPHAFNLPEENGRCIVFCKELLEPLRTHSMLIWYDDWAVWPNRQWHPMFERFAEALGATQPLIERPAYFFSEAEYVDALSAFLWVGLFGWDCHIVSPDFGYCIHLSHHSDGESRFPLHNLWKDNFRS